MSIIGSSTNNNIIIGGSFGGNMITGGNGNDTITSNADGDTIVDGNGNNVINGGDFAQTITVGNGNNTIFGLTGASSVTAGNGDNTITDADTDAASTISVGTGSNDIVLGTGNTDGLAALFTVNLAKGHSFANGIDTITIGASSAADAATAASQGVNLVLSGAKAGDVIAFSNDANATNKALIVATAQDNIGVTHALQVSNTIANMVDDLYTAGKADSIAYSVVNHNTYVVETLSGAAGAYDLTVIELTGVHTLAVTNHQLQILS